MGIETIILIVVLVAFIFVTYRGQKVAATMNEAEKKAAQIADKASKDAEGMLKEAKNMMREARITAKDEKAKLVKEFERETKERRAETQKMEKRVLEREKNLERKLDMLEERSSEIGKREDLAREKVVKLEEKQKKLDEVYEEQRTKLEQLSGMSREEAKKFILERMDKELGDEKGAIVRRHAEDVKKSCDRQAQSVLVSAIQRYAGDCTYERTSAIIHLPNDEMKGRIIGREGRNIRVIEAATGASVLVDDTPDAVVVSCFDPVRKEIARVTMQRLIEDGRIHPTRIEETINKVKKDIDSEKL